jgi:hypothetical protein
MMAVLKDDTELFKQFSDNESFRRRLTDMVFSMTYDAPAPGACRPHRLPTRPVTQNTSVDPPVGGCAGRMPAPVRPVPRSGKRTQRGDSSITLSAARVNGVGESMGAQLFFVSHPERLVNGSDRTGSREPLRSGPDAPDPDRRGRPGRSRPGPIGSATTRRPSIVRTRPPTVCFRVPPLPTRRPPPRRARPIPTTATVRTQPGNPPRESGVFGAKGSHTIKQTGAESQSLRRRGPQFSSTRLTTSDSHPAKGMTDHERSPDVLPPLRCLS